ncbi:hypothetical protein DL96DRAFT_1620263 [Flagelloscypha sp. PMI_526]|nr:hypothetical protein DL96DRAFT_1620263 [Flagelloscypha sp. PMI_526]
MAFNPFGAVKTSYELPPLVDKCCAAWIRTLQTSAVVSALLAVVQGQLMGVFKQNLGPSESKIREALLILNYIALICSIGATMTSLLLSDEFSEIPMRSARAAALATDNPDVIVATNWRVLLYWHVKPKTKLLVWHWFVSLAVACLCTIASVTLYAVTQETLATRIAISVAAGFSVLPLVWVIVPASSSVT